MPARRILYFEPVSGISGDMFIGALLDLGVDFERLRQQLQLLPLRGYQLRHSKCLKAGIHASKFDVLIDEAPTEGHVDQKDLGHKHSHASHPNRSFGGIREMIGRSGLSPWVKERSTEAFRRLAEAEGKIHAQAPEQVHFHEVGAIDSIVDIVGTMIALEMLMPATIFSGAVNVGQGTLECRHGIYPVPGPATQELLRGVPTFVNSVSGELTTPTGAALLVTLVGQFGSRPPMKVESTGYGAGTRDTPGSANVLRITIGEEIEEFDEASIGEKVTVIEADIDDMSPQVFGYFQEMALAAGALDVNFMPVQMKKNRPAVRLTVICAPEMTDEIARLIFCETTTIGIRYTSARRKTLHRDFVRVKTGFGEVEIKTASLDGHEVNFVPEYDDCRRLAVEKGIPLKTVQAAAIQAYLEFRGQTT